MRLFRIICCLCVALIATQTIPCHGWTHRLSDGGVYVSVLCVDNNNYIDNAFLSLDSINPQLLSSDLVLPDSVLVDYRLEFVGYYTSYPAIEAGTVMPIGSVRPEVLSCANPSSITLPRSLCAIGTFTDKMASTRTLLRNNVGYRYLNHWFNLAEATWWTGWPYVDPMEGLGNLNYYNSPIAADKDSRWFVSDNDALYTIGKTLLIRHVKHDEDTYAFNPTESTFVGKRFVDSNPGVKVCAHAFDGVNQALEIPAGLDAVVDDDLVGAGNVVQFRHVRIADSDQPLSFATGNNLFTSIMADSVYIGRSVHSTNRSITILRDLTIGSQVYEIEQLRLGLVKKVTFLSPIPPTATVCMADYQYTTLYVPKGSVSAYRADHVWGRFTNITDGSLSVNDADLNGDGILDISDVNIIINLMLGKPDPRATVEVADVNHDSLLDIVDINMVINAMLGR